MVVLYSMHELGNQQVTAKKQMLLKNNTMKIVVDKNDSCVIIDT